MYRTYVPGKCAVQVGEGVGACLALEGAVLHHVPLACKVPYFKKTLFKRNLI